MVFAKICIEKRAPRESNSSDIKMNRAYRSAQAKKGLKFNFQTIFGGVDGDTFFVLIADEFDSPGARFSIQVFAKAI